MTLRYEDSDLAFKRRDELIAQGELEYLKNNRKTIADELRKAAAAVEMLEPEDVWPVIKDLFSICERLHEWGSLKVSNEVELRRFRLSGSL